MSDWIEAELAGCQMHDARHTKRLARLLSQLCERPVGSIPTPCHDWAETVAAYGGHAGACQGAASGYD